MYPFAEEGGFAEAGRGGDEGEFVGKAAVSLLKHRVQPLDQARAQDPLRPDGGEVELGLKKGRDHLLENSLREIYGLVFGRMAWIRARGGESLASQTKLGSRL